MRNGDLGNSELPRIWFVVEGLVLLPTGAKRKRSRKIRDEYSLSTIAFRRIWDLVWRYDFRVNLVTFEIDVADDMQKWLNEIDFPAPLYAHTLEDFMDSILPLPSCYSVYDADPRRAFMYGGKGVLVDPHTDFQIF